jgi:hypothetical protein
MKNLLTIGLIVSLFLIPLGCAHTPDRTGAVPEQPQTTAAPVSATPAPAADTAQTNGTPVLELSETTFDFGLVSDGNDYIHAFKMRNTGTGVLIIRKILPG